MQRSTTALRPLIRVHRLAPPPFSSSSSSRFVSSTAVVQASQPIGRIEHVTSAFPAYPSHAGPFPLPSADEARAARIEATQRKWKQLGTVEKAGRAATQTGSAVVVLFGAGLVALVAYAFGSELFSEASPTRVFEDCVERVKADPELPSILLPPHSFHGSSSSSRTRQRHIQHSYSQDPQTGTETLFVRFYLDARSPLDQHAGESWMDWAKRWVGPLIWEDSSNPGAYQPVLSGEEKERREKVEREEREREEKEKRKKTWSGWLGANLSLSAALGGFLGGEKGFRGAKGDEGSGSLFRRQRKPAPGEFTTGEVVAELEKDRTTGHFVYKQLFVAIPDSHHPSYYRHNISTETVITPAEGEGQGAQRYRFWSRSKTV
ncbi:hypothetical protein JCM11641_001299 [Rhodosporidiobolus odoratus]